MGHRSLSRQVGIPGALLLGLGSMIGTGVFISLAFAMEVAGNGIFIAILLAGLLAMCNGLSSAQLAAVHPVSGGTYEYGYRFLTPALGFLAGWMFLVAKSASAATAALGFSAYIIHVAGLNLSVWLVPMAWLIVLLLTLVAWLGLRRTNMANAILLTCTLGGLALFVIAAFWNEPIGLVDGPASLAGSWKQIGYAAALVFVAFTGYGRVATLGEEIRNPAKSIPVAVVITVLITLGLYLCVAAACVHVAGTTGTAAAFDQNAAALAVLASEHLGGGFGLAVTCAAATAMLGVLLNLMVGLSRIVLAMARRHDLPIGLAQLNEDRTSPTHAVLAVSAVLLCWVSLGEIRLVWSLSALTVLVYYGVTNLAALRIPRELRRLPRLVPLTGLAGCAALALMIEGGAWRLGGVIAGLGMIAFWLNQSVFRRQAL